MVAYINVGAPDDSRCQIPWSQSYIQVAGNYLTWVLGPEIGSSGRAVHILNYWAISLVSHPWKAKF